MEGSFYTQIQHVLEGFELKERGLLTIHNTPVSNIKLKNGTDGVEQVADLIYDNFYCRGTQKEEDSRFAKSDISARFIGFDWELQKEFVNGLRLANTSLKSFSKGWKVKDIGGDGTLYVEKGSNVRTCFAGEYVRDNFLNRSLDKGETLRIVTRKEFFSVKDGFYHVFGNTLAEGGFNIVRLYFNIHVEGVAILIEELTEHFNKYKLPFHFKCLNNLGHYTRADAAVLYLNKRYYNYAIKIFNNFYDAISPYLKKGIPLFTKKVFEGVGFAENPPNGDSFGMSRSRIIAQAIVQAIHSDIPKPNWTKLVIKLINDHNLHVDKIHLNPNSNYDYDFSG